MPPAFLTLMSFKDKISITATVIGNNKCRYYKYTFNVYKVEPHEIAIFIHLKNGQVSVLSYDSIHLKC